MITLLVGIIASGKSSYIKTLDLTSGNTIVLNDDALVTMLHGGDYKLYNKNLSKLYKAIDYSIIQNALLMNINIIIDKTNITKDSRLRYISMAKAFGHKVNCVYFQPETAEIHAKRRYNSDARGHSYEKWLNVAEAQLNILEQPSLAEGIDEIIRYKWENCVG